MANKKTGEKPEEPKNEEVAPFPPPGEEHLSPDEAAAQAQEQTEPQEKKVLRQAADTRVAFGGQSSARVSVPPATDERITAEELAQTKQPKAPEVPLAPSESSDDNK